MYRIRTIIIEDELLIRERIASLLEEDEELELIGQADNGADGLEMIKDLKPDLLFLDIQLPQKNGFDVLDELAIPELPIVIFVTAYDEFALKAFEVEAFDYLLKPFDKDRLRQSVDRAKKRWEERQQHQSRYPNYLIAKKEKLLVPVNVEEIYWIEAARNYVLLYTGDDHYTLRASIQDMEKQLDPIQFKRIHRSRIINTYRIASLQHLYQGDYRIALTNGKVLTSSRSYRDNLQTILQKK